MVDLTGLLGTGTAAVTLAEKVMQMIEASKQEEGSTRLTEIVQSIRSSAIDLCRDTSDELRKLTSDLRKSQIDTTKSIAELNDNLKWYNFVSSSKLKRYERRFYGIYEQLSAFIDDVTAVLICSESTESLRVPLRKAREQKKRIDDLVNSERPIGEIVREMLEINEVIYYRLQGGSSSTSDDDDTDVSGDR